VYSGTAAAARQAVIMGLPALATSLPFNQSKSSLHRAVEFIAKNLAVFKKLSSPDHFLNINFPQLDSKPLELAVTFPSLRIYKDKLDTRKEADGTIYCKIDGPPPETRGEQGSDYDAIASGRISISPVSIHPNNHRIENRYETSVIWTGEEG
jgi:5'-nucleotidase